MGLSKRDIVFDIDVDGNITITVEGVKGQDCTALTKELEESFGVVIDRTHTSEYYQDDANSRLTIKLGGD